jgi:hypothetical protein
MTDIFDRNMFNRLYYEWFQAVHERDPELAKECDIQVIPRLGKKMAQKIKETLPGDKSSIEYISEALSLSHWFQEDVTIAEKGNNYVILQTKNCAFEKHWIKKFGKPLYCIPSHGAFLTEFCSEINPRAKIENLVAPVENPKDDIYCKWKISLDY